MNPGVLGARADAHASIARWTASQLPSRKRLTPRLPRGRSEPSRWACNSHLPGTYTSWVEQRAYIVQACWSSRSNS
eukprot:11546834-Alexandrium_andersonii.AAC.1